MVGQLQGSVLAMLSSVLSDTRGASSVEYIVVVVLVALGGYLAWSSFGDSVGTAAEDASSPFARLGEMASQQNDTASGTPAGRSTVGLQGGGNTGGQSNTAFQPAPSGGTAGHVGGSANGFQGATTFLGAQLNGGAGASTLSEGASAGGASSAAGAREPRMGSLGNLQGRATMGTGGSPNDQGAGGDATPGSVVSLQNGIAFAGRTGGGGGSSQSGSGAEREVPLISVGSAQESGCSGSSGWEMLLCGGVLPAILLFGIGVAMLRRGSRSGASGSSDSKAG